jgi:hypothetical protein
VILKRVAIKVAFKIEYRDRFLQKAAQKLSLFCGGASQP